MRLTGLIKKTVLENIRDWKILVLILTFAPFFVFLMYFYFGDTAKVYRVMVVNLDKGIHQDNGVWFRAGRELIAEMGQVRSPEGENILKIQQERNLKDALQQVKNRVTDLVVEIPPDFSKSLIGFKKDRKSRPALVRTHGNPASFDYMMAAVWSDVIAYQYVSRVTGWEAPLNLQALPVGSHKSLSGFDMYVPALLALAVIMLMFTAAASLIREKDKGTLVRLRMSRMTTSEWLLAVSVTQVILGLMVVGLAFLSARMVGYESHGSLLAMAVVVILSSLSVMAIGVVVASFLRTIFDLMTIGCFPFFILMFFSGGMFPLPRFPLFSLLGRTVNANDLLPTTHTISAFNKILNFGASLKDIIFEIGAIVVLTGIIFWMGIWLFVRRHMVAR